MEIQLCNKDVITIIAKHFGVRTEDITIDEYNFFNVCDLDVEKFKGDKND